MITKVLLATAGCVAIAFAHNSYTGGYSGAPGGQSCASSCHGGTVGTLVVTGFPAVYQPQHTYNITVKHNGGSKIVNFNATTRVGSTTNVAGIFAAGTNSAVYSGADGGVYANPHSVDSAVFQWTAPAAGTGSVNLYVAAFQGTTTAASGQSSKVALSALQNTTDVENETVLPGGFALDQNFPNPFNPTTAISYQLSAVRFVTLRVYDSLGRVIATLVNGWQEAGSYSVKFEGNGLASGIYFYQLRTGDFKDTKKFVLLR